MTQELDETPLVVVANRLPVEFDHEAGDWRAAPGGLVTAMESVLRHRRALWIGWNGIFSDEADTVPPLPAATGELELDEVPLSRAEIEGYYEGCSNGAIWPLYHDAIVPPVYHRTQFESYRRVNEKFAWRRSIHRCGYMTTSCSCCPRCCARCGLI